MAEIAVGLGVFGLFALFLVAVTSRRVTRLEERVRALEQGPR
jgi:hypothetical protein